MLFRVLGRADDLGIGLSQVGVTDYVNTIPAADEPSMPGDEEMEHRIRRLIRWNAAVMVSRANHRFDGIGGHLATYASAATLYEVGFNHFFHGKADGGFGDQVFFQGHASPGIYARGYLEGRLDEGDLDRFRREVGGGGLPSYPHPRRSDFWEFPTVSMGLGPLTAAYQARFNRYLHDRGIVDTSAAKVWCFIGDGEMDEPESLAGLAFAGRERLDNLIFVVNCNLQRLDGPVRGNGKVIQELEALYRGAGWNVIKVVWGREWDDLLARDTDGAARCQDERHGRRRIPEVPRRIGRLHPRALLRSRPAAAGPGRGPLRRRPAPTAPRRSRRPQGPRRLPRGRRPSRRSHCRAGQDGQGLVTRLRLRSPQRHPPDEEDDRSRTEDVPRPARTTDHRRATRRGAPPIRPAGCRFRRARVSHGPPPVIGRPAAGPRGPAQDIDPARREPLSRAPRRHRRQGRGIHDVRVHSALEEPACAIPESADESCRSSPTRPRTFGIDALFRQSKIYAPAGQRYEPVDADLLLSYMESADGQILEEGITEAGSMASLIAASTAYATWGEPMIPFFVFYSMFGFHRLGDLIWALGDMRGRGFLMAATAGRTTLQGEGLQHTDGYSHAWAATVPNCRAYDPAFAYELAVIIDDGMRRMYGADPEDVFYYVTLYNETYPMPPIPDGAQDGIIRGLYRYRPAPEPRAHRSQILASGTAMLAALEAQRLLADEHDVAADVWSATSYKQLRDDALSVERWNRLHPTDPPQRPYVAEVLADVDGPIVAVTDFVKTVPDQIARWVPQPFIPLGTDGFGLSDTRTALRQHFEVDARHIVVATLSRARPAGRTGE